jgi:hypothetical protein
MVPRRLPNIRCLGTFGPLDNFEFDHIPFFEGTVTVPDDAGIVNKDVRAIVAPYEAIALGVVEPLHDSTHFVPSGLKQGRGIIIRFLRNSF